MSVTIQPLFAPVQLGNVVALYYTALVATRIDKLTLVNPSLVTAYTATVYLVGAGEAPSDANAIIKNRPLQPQESYDVWSLIGHNMGAGYSLHALASVAAAVNIFGSGTLVTA